MTQRERLEDLGRVFEIIDQLVDNEFFEYLNSKHDYESWIKKHLPAYKCSESETILDVQIYDIHMKLRHLKEKLLEIWSIARGENE